MDKLQAIRMDAELRLLDTSFAPLKGCPNADSAAHQRERRVI